MKRVFLLMLLMCSVTAFAQKKVNNQFVDAACAMCQFKVKGQQGCAMAVKLNGKIYNVEGIDRKEFGPMHSDDGYCKVVRKAQVSGTVKNGKFYATDFKYVK